MLMSKVMTESVCFVCCYNKRGELVPVGTGFFVGVQPVGNESNSYMGIVVTALHVINGIQDVRRSDNRVFLRVNTQDGGFDHVEIPADEWIKPDPTHPGGIVDAAVCHFPCDNVQKFDFKFLGVEYFSQREVLAGEDIGIGNDVFLAGLFIKHTATKRNEPIVRSGTIAAMPETISSKSGPQHAYLVESRSIGGLSGSPVFVEAGLTRHDDAGNLQMRRGGRASYLLGVISGHWEAEAEVKEIGEAIRHEYVNIGIAIVTPADKVMPLINECVNRKLKIAADLKEAIEQELNKFQTAMTDGLNKLGDLITEIQQSDPDVEKQPVDGAPSDQEEEEPKSAPDGP